MIWQIHTTARIMHGMYMAFSIIIVKPKPISSVTLVMIVAFVLTVIPFFLTKASRCFLYIFVPINQSCSFFEDLAKQKTVTRKNGTVGRIGNTIPTQPRLRQIQPRIKYNNLLSFTDFSPIVFSLSLFRLHAALPPRDDERSSAVPKSA